MATAIEFPEVNGVRRAPKGMDHAHDLAVHVDVEAGVVTSCWQLSDAELMEVVRTRGKIWLQVMGGHPPVILCGVKPIPDAQGG